MTGQQQAHGLVMSLEEAERPAAVTWFGRPCEYSFSLVREQSIRKGFLAAFPAGRVFSEMVNLSWAGENSRREEKMSPSFN